MASASSSPISNASHSSMVRSALANRSETRFASAATISDVASSGDIMHGTVFKYLQESKHSFTILGSIAFVTSITEVNIELVGKYHGNYRT
jgi:hypothetical protein